MVQTSTSILKPRMIKTCSIWRALEAIGDKPILLILEAMWMGARRFSELEKSTGLLKALLSNRLTRLISLDLIQKRLIVPGKRTSEYIFTNKGLDLFPTVMALYRWERDWNSDRYNFDLIHEMCGEVFLPIFKCGSCGEPFDLTDVHWAEGPGVGWMDNQYLRRRQSAQTKTKRPSLLEGSVDILGDRWSALIMRSIFMGQKRFDQIQKELAIGSGVLSERLKKLQSKSILKSRSYQTNPVRYEYTLPQKGVEYYQIIMMLMFWGDKHYASKSGPPLILTHKTCGQLLNPEVSCGHCAEKLALNDVKIIPKA